MNRMPPVTRALLIANVVIFGLQVAHRRPADRPVRALADGIAAVSRARRRSRSGSC